MRGEQTPKPTAEIVSTPYVEIREDDKPQDECGVLAIYAPNLPLGQITYDAMQRLQHRGQSGAGIAYAIAKDMLMGHSDNGLIDKAIPDLVPSETSRHILDECQTPIVVGHTRYSTAKNNNASQPFFGRQTKFALAHNGHVETIPEIADAYGVEYEEVISDSWLLTQVIDARAKQLEDGSIDMSDRFTPLEAAILEIAPQLEGAYCLTITDGERIIGVRDPWGTHPLVLGRMPAKQGHVIASETVALEAAGASFVRDIEPGEMVVIDAKGVRSSRIEREEQRAHCMFEYIYIAKPDGIVNGVSVYAARKSMGRHLAIDQPVDADIVVGVPNSGLSAAAGYAQESGIPQVLGLFKDDYVARSFIERAGKRDDILRRKLSPNKDELRGQRVVLVDDSLIKGNTMKSLVHMIRDAGATEVHVRSAAPRYMYPCYGGMDTRETSRLIASNNDNERIAGLIGANSVGFNSVKRIQESVHDARTDQKSQQKIGSLLCTGCASGRYPYQTPELPKAEARRIDLLRREVELSEV